jgi:hypothetical protein
MHIPRSLRFLPLAFALVLTATSALAQAPSNQATVSVSGRKYVFKNVVAVRGKYDDEGRVVVLASGQPIPADKLNKAKAVDAEDYWDAELNVPYLKAAFQEDGTLRNIVCKHGSGAFGGRGDGLKGQATIADGRIRGSLTETATGTFARDVAFTFDVPIDAAVMTTGPAKLDPPVKPTVSGKFIGNGKAAAIKFVTVLDHEPFSGQEAITLIFTEKDLSAAKNPGVEATFGKYGSALELNVHVDGGIFGCQVAHSAHEKKGFTSLGKIHMAEFEIVGGNVKGHVRTGEVLDTFGEKWEVDLKFAAPLPEKRRTAAPPKPAMKETAPAPAPSPAKAAASSGISARALPLPKDAQDVQFKDLVEQIHLASPRPVAAVADEMSARLKEQGWKEGKGGVRGPKNAILSREKGDAKLTIMIRGVESGSEIKIFADGLDWSGGK